MENYDVQSFDLSISKEHETEDLVKVVRSVRPQWKEQDIRFEKLSGGIVNTMYCCWSKEEERKTEDVRPEKIVVRIFLDPTSFNLIPEEFKGSEGNTEFQPSEDKNPLDHSKEIKNLQHLKGYGIAPELLALFKNGLCYRYMYGKTLDCTSIRSEALMPHVTKLMARLHSIPLLPGSTAWGVKDAEMTAYVYPPKFDDPERNRRLLEVFPDKESVFAELKCVEELLKDVQSPTVFAHNDSKGENFIWDEERGILSLVDFEHSSDNLQAEDIASHFVVYNDVCNSKPDQHPSRDHQLKWIRMYLRYWFEFTGKNPDDVTEKDVETVYVNVNKCAQKTRLLIGVCCLFLSSQGIFDTYEFCLQLLKDYLSYKEETKSLLLPK